MNIPDKHESLVKLLVARHLAEQVQQVRMIGRYHPAAVKAREHLEEARDLARIAGVATDKAA